MTTPCTRLVARGFSLGLALIFTLTVIGCSSDDAVKSSTVLVPTVEEDVSESVAGSIAADNGGIIDELGDITELAQESAEFTLALKPEVAALPVYDSITGTWTLEINKERGYPNGQHYARYTRTYTYQYRNQDGEPQREWRVGQDTARSIHITVVDGNGYCRTLRLGGYQTQVLAQWVAQGANTDTLSISGACQRSGVDTLKSHQAVRTLAYQLAMQFSNLRCLRGAGSDAAGEVRGDLAANFTAAVTFMSGPAYGDTNVVRTMAIEMNQGEAQISVNGQSYSGDLATGDLGN